MSRHLTGVGREAVRDFETVPVGLVFDISAESAADGAGKEEKMEKRKSKAGSDAQSSTLRTFHLAPERAKSHPIER